MRSHGDGALSPHGEPKPLSRRAVHMCVDPGGRYTLNAHNFPSSGITVHSIARDGRIAVEIDQRLTLDLGIYPHQVMMFPSGRTALIVDRGNNAQGDEPEDPGALRSFGFEDGTLRAGQVLAPNGGHGFGPRHVAFHPSKPWIYVSDERRNRLYMVHFADDRMDDEPAYTRETLADPQNVRPRQLAGPIHVHPGGRWVYVVNRADSSVDYRDTKVFAGGENNIAVYSLDQGNRGTYAHPARRDALLPCSYVRLRAGRASPGDGEHQSPRRCGRRKRGVRAGSTVRVPHRRAGPPRVRPQVRGRNRG